MGDWIPVFSQVKSLVQVFAGDYDGARRTNLNFCRTCPVVSQGFSLGQLMAGDIEGAKDTLSECSKTMGGVVNGIPIVGHAKGIVHYVANDKDGGDDAMKAASRSIGVAAGGIAGTIVGGPVGGFAGGIMGGSTMDATISIVDSTIHNEKRMYGLYKTFEKIENGDMSSGDFVDTVTGFVFDGMAGLSTGQAFEKINETNRSAPTNRNVTEHGNRNVQKTTIKAVKGNLQKNAVKAAKGNVKKNVIKTAANESIQKNPIKTVTGNIQKNPIKTVTGNIQKNPIKTVTGNIQKTAIKAAANGNMPKNAIKAAANGNMPKNVIKAASGTAMIAYACKDAVISQTTALSGCDRIIDDTTNISYGSKAKTSDSSNTGKTDDKGAKPKARPSDLSNTEQTDEKGEKAKTRQSDSSNTGKTDDKDYKSTNGQNRRSSFRMRSSKRKEIKDKNVPLEAPFAVKVKSIKDLKRGMHIKWKRKIGYTHHALVTDVNTDTNQIEVIHFTSGNLKNECNINDKAIIKQEWLNFDSNNLFRLEYNCRLSPESAIENAQRALKLSRKEFLKKYNLLENNCEHLITYFVTGNHHSFQAETVKGITKASVACGLSITSASKSKTTEPFTKSDFKNETSSDTDSEENC